MAKNLKKETKKVSQLELAQIDNGRILLQQVLYGEKNTVDPNSTSNVFYEVAKDCEGTKWKKGDLVKCNSRLYQTVELDGDMYIYTLHSEIILTLPKEIIDNEVLFRQ